jgi:hypothetical protein
MVDVERWCRGECVEEIQVLLASKIHIRVGQIQRQGSAGEAILDVTEHVHDAAPLDVDDGRARADAASQLLANGQVELPVAVPVAAGHAQQTIHGDRVAELGGLLALESSRSIGAGQRSLGRGGKLRGAHEEVECGGAGGIQLDGAPERDVVIPVAVQIPDRGSLQPAGGHSGLGNKEAADVERRVGGLDSEVGGATRGTPSHE